MPSQNSFTIPITHDFFVHEYFPFTAINQCSNEWLAPALSLRIDRNFLGSQLVKCSQMVLSSYLSGELFGLGFDFATLVCCQLLLRRCFIINQLRYSASDFDSLSCLCSFQKLLESPNVSKN